MGRRLVESPVFAIGLIVALGVAYALLARFVLHGVPFSGDEYSTSLQSELFAHGMLQSPAPTRAEWLRVDPVIIDAWVRSKYPPGTSILQAPGVWIGAPWLVTPVEATITLLLVWHTIRKLFGPAAALAGVIVLGFAPLFVMTSTSFFAHTPALMFLTAGFAAIVTWLDTRQDRWLVITGCAIGCAFLVRPFDAVLFGVAMASLRSWRALIVTAAAAVPFLGIHLWYQYAQFGSPLTSGYELYEPTFRAIYGDIGGKSLGLDQFLSVHQRENHLDILKTMMFGSTVLAAPLFALVGARPTNETKLDLIRAFCVALIVLFVLALLFTLAEPDDGPRARYLTITLLPLSVLGAAGLQRAWTALRTKLAIALASVVAVLAIAYALNATATSMKYHAFEIWFRTGPARLGEKLPANAVVIIRATFPTRYARNGAFFDGVLYLSVPSTVSDDEVRAAYPDRPIWSLLESQRWRYRRVQ